MIVADVNLNECETCGRIEKTYVFGVNEKLELLKHTIRSMANAIDNGTPDLALREIRRVVQAMEEWDA